MERLFEPPPKSEVDRGVPTQKYRLWSEHKARLVERYLYRFVLVTHHGTYIDGFAGPQDAIQPATWTAKRVIEIEPPWLKHFYLYDRQAAQVRHLQQLEADHPDRHIVVRQGDFNERVGEILTHAVIPETEAAFCLLDQWTNECHWRTVQQLASHKSKYKIEIFYFLAQWWLDRAIGGAAPDNPEYRAWWGSPQWPMLGGMKGWDRAELLAKRFRTELNYRFVRPWAIYSRAGGGGHIAYFMIHASDHPRADPLMSEAYREVVSIPPHVDQPELFS